MHWLQYVRKERLKNIHGTTLKVYMLANVSGAYSAISSVKIPMCDWAPLT